MGQAKFARSQFVTKEFSGRPVACGFFDEAQFRNEDYDIQDKVIIAFWFICICIILFYVRCVYLIMMKLDICVNLLILP